MKAIPVNLCNNVLLRGFRDNIDISPMKLQKFLYYICCNYVKETGRSPISEEFEVWAYGPVLPSVYGEFKSFGAKPITEYAQDAQGHSFKVNEAENPILSKILDIIWAKYKYYSGIDLSKMTHKEASGWNRAYQANRETITVEDMAHDRSEE